MDEDQILVISTISIVGSILLCCLGLFIKDVFCYKIRNKPQLQKKLLDANEIV